MLLTSVPLKCTSAIRCHHLVKTFYAGFGWRDRQLPDGTVTFTVLSALAQPTEDLGDISVPDESTNRGVMMPTRKQTREQDRRDRIYKERRERKQLDAQERRKRNSWLAANEKPPSF